MTAFLFCLCSCFVMRSLESCNNIHQLLNDFAISGQFSFDFRGLFRVDIDAVNSE